MHTRQDVSFLNIFRIVEMDLGVRVLGILKPCMIVLRRETAQWIKAVLLIT